jgi:hypothetical protein
MHLDNEQRRTLLTSSNSLKARPPIAVNNNDNNNILLSIKTSSLTIQEVCNMYVLLILLLSINSYMLFTCIFHVMLFMQIQSLY